MLIPNFEYSWMKSVLFNQHNTLCYLIKIYYAALVISIWNIHTEYANCKMVGEVYRRDTYD